MDDKKAAGSHWEPKTGQMVCPECGSDKVETGEEDYAFVYGTGDDRVELSARIPIRKCGDCELSFRDHVADGICHEAVCRYLGVMTPSQIRSLRGLHDLSQARFSKLTKIGEATLSRWERGVLVQNEAYDNYLYLLGFRENMERIRGRNKGETSFDVGGASVVTPTFRELVVTPDLLEDKARFLLSV